MKKSHLLFFLLPCVVSWCLSGQPAYNMNLLGQWTEGSLNVSQGVRYNDLWGYRSGGRDYALLGSLSFVHFIDVTNPGSPQEISRIGGGGSTIWRDIKTYGNHAYAVSESSVEGLLVFDLASLPAAVTKTAQLSDVFTRAHNLFIDGGFAFVVGAPQGTNRDLIVYDLRTNPDNPTHLGSFSLNHGDGYVHDIFVDGTTAYASHGDFGLAVYDLTLTLFPPDGIPQAPTQLGIFDSYFNPGYNHSSWVSGNLMVVADETHGSPLSIVDISDFEDLQEMSYFHSNRLGVANPYSDAGPIAHNPFIVGTDCYVSHYHEGVVVFDISDPENVEIAAYYDTEPGNSNYAGFRGCWGVYPFLGSNKILATDVENGLFILDKSNALPNLPLPVVWGAFKASLRNEAIQLDWSTSEEVANKGFHVERQNSAGSFQRIGWVAPELDQTYVFLDKKARPGRNDYRLAQEDWDGMLHYSRLVHATLPLTEQTVRFFPTLARPGISLQLRGNTALLRYPLKLYGADGRCWQTYTAEGAAQGLERLHLPAALPAGTYHVVDQGGWQQQVLVN